MVNRSLLQNIESIYRVLYRSWYRSVYGALVLNMLCGCYKHCCDILDILLGSTVTYNLLVTVDKLVKVIESSGFARE